MKKNEGGQVVAFQAVSATDGSAVTTGSPTVYVTIDGGTQASGTNTAIHEGQGVWSYAPTQAETNGDHVVYTFTLAGCINQSVNVYPVVVSDYQADVSSLATQTSVDTIDGIVDTILIDTNDLQTNQGNWLTATGFNTVAPDNAGIAANGVAIAALNDFDPASDTVLVGDKTGFSLSTAANEAIGTSFLAHVLTKGNAGTIERTFWQLAKTQTLADGEVSGTPTESAFDTNLTTVTGAYDHLLLVFASGPLNGEARPIDSYSSVNGRITLQEPLTAAPSATDEFIIVPDHNHAVSDIAIGVRNLILAGDQSPITMAGNKVSNVILVDTTTDLTNQSGSGNVTVEGFTNAALLEMIQTDTGVTVAGDGSVAKISQGAAGGNVTVGAFTQTALAEMATTDTGETSATTGSVVQLSQSGATAGPGSRIYTENVTSDGVPVQDVDVWVTTDQEGTNTIAGTIKTDVDGNAVFTLDPGTYYVWAQKDGYCFSNPNMIQVT